MEDSPRESRPDSTEAPQPGASSPEDTSPIPLVAGGHSSRLHRATNLLSLGQVQEAAALCREEVAENPRCADAYALLAMAEEQAGNLHLAVEVYEELLRLDPDRRLEAEHLEELRQELEEVEAEEPSPEEREEQLRRLQPVAWIVLIGAALFLVSSLGLFLVVRHRVADTQAQYKTALGAGAYYYQTAQYTSAMAWFGEALRLRPGDVAAREWYAAAYRQSRLLASRARVTQSRLASRLSPFKPVPIGEPAAAQDTTRPEPPSVTVAPPPLITGGPRQPVSPPPSPDEGTGGFLPPPTDEGRGLIFPPRPAVVPSESSPPPAETPAPVEQPQPIIKITVSDRPTPVISAQERGDNLRAQGKRLYQEGNYAEAISTYQQALAAYREELSAHPEKRPALDSSIATIQAEIRLCEKSLQ